MKLEERLVTVRKGKGMSQEQLAEQVGVSRQAVSKWETGEALPDYAKLLALADALEVSLDYLCGRADGPTAEEQAAVPKGHRPIWKWVAVGVAAVALLVIGLMIGLHWGGETSAPGPRPTAEPGDTVPVGIPSLLDTIRSSTLRILIIVIELLPLCLQSLIV